MQSIDTALNVLISGAGPVVTTDFYYVLGPTGVFRWAWPVSSKKNLHLKTYSPATVKGKLFKLASSLAGSLRLNNFIASGKLSVPIAEDSPLQSVIKQQEAEEFSLFLGTPSAEQTPICVFLKNDELYFCKFSISELSQANIAREIDGIQRFTELNVYGLDLPELSSFHNGDYFITRNLTEIGHLNSTVFNTQQQKILIDLWNKTSKKIPIKDLRHWDTIPKFLSKMRQPQTKLDASKLAVCLDKIAILHDKYHNSTEEIFVSVVHGDFVPWNMIARGDNLGLIDFELWQEAAPYLHDLIHLFIQKNILTPNGDIHKALDGIKKSVRSFGQNPKLKQYEPECLRDYIELYTIEMCMKYLPYYIEQEQLFVQADWLLSCWAEILTLDENYYLQ